MECIGLVQNGGSCKVAGNDDFLWEVNDAPLIVITVYGLGVCESLDVGNVGIKGGPVNHDFQGGKGVVLGRHAAYRANPGIHFRMSSFCQI
jgi:hypothetical protein